MWYTVGNAGSLVRFFFVFFIKKIKRIRIKSKASIYKLKQFSTKKIKKYIEILLKKTHKQFENMKKSNGSPGPP